MEVRSGPESSPISRSEMLLAAAIALEAAVILLRNDPGGLSGDPDSYMRLARFRDGYPVFHGGFFPRDNAPYGTVVPWTMPMDGALAIFYALGRAFADPGGALYFAARIVSPFFHVTIGLLLFFGLRPFFSLRARVIMAGLAVTAPQLVPYSLPGDADHHAMVVWFSVLFGVALIRHLFLDAPGYRHAAAVGIAAAGTLWIGAEAFATIASGLCGLVLYRCLVKMPPGSRTRARDLALGGAFAIALTAAWLVDRPYEGLWALDVDRLSIVYVSFAWLFSATLIALDAYLARRAALSPSRNLIVAALLGGTAFLAWIAIAPDILRGPLGQVDRTLFGVWIDQVLEMQPIWRSIQGPAPHAICLILIWGALAVLIARCSGRERSLWTACAILMVPVTILGIRYVRAMYYTEVFGAIPLGLVLADYTRRYPKYIGYGAVAASTCLMFGAHDAAILVQDLLMPTDRTRAALAATAAACGPEKLAQAIAPIRDTDAIVMTELNFAPWVLYLSPRLRTVAAGYMRNKEGILDEFAFFEAHDDREARAILEKRGVAYVLICDRGEKQHVDFLRDRILHATPAWLQPVGASSPEPGYRLYRVRSANG